ncbi:MAG: hypothetical protein ACK4NU_04045 [Brevundimonas sp.]
MFLATLLAVATLAQDPNVAQPVPPSWPPEASARTPLNALEYPTTLQPVDRSLTDLLNQGGKVVNAYVGAAGPVVTVQKRDKVTICLVVGPNPTTDQNVPTSRCYALN